MGQPKNRVSGITRRDDYGQTQMRVFGLTETIWRPPMGRHDRRYILTALVLSSVGCTGKAVTPVPQARGHTCRAIRAVLEDQANAWNRGDVESFMAGYWKSPELTFVSGGTSTHGWQETRDRYHRRYPTRAAMGHLTFSELNVRELTRDAALVSGRWQLDRGEPIGGCFTLLFRYRDNRWVIVYDHTSVGDTTPDTEQ